MEEINWRGELRKKLSERDGKMYSYYKAVFEEGYDGGYPISYDEEIEALFASQLKKVIEDIHPSHPNHGYDNNCRDYASIQANLKKKRGLDE